MIRLMSRSNDGREGRDESKGVDLKTGGHPEAEEEADALMEAAFPTDGVEARDLSRGRIFAVIPDGAIEADPEYFAFFLEQVFEAGDEVEALLEKLVSDEGEVRQSGRSLEVIVPPHLLSDGGGSTVAFLDRVFEAFEEIDLVLSDMQASRRPLPRIRVDVSTVVVPEEAVGDPIRLMRVVDRMQGEADKLDLIFRQAKHDLKRLSRFRISKKAPGAVIGDMREGGELVTLQYLVSFLHSIYLAADSFEALEIPRPHIRDYLEFLYRMEDWDAMARLVRRLEQAVRRYSKLRGTDDG